MRYVLLVAIGLSLAAGPPAAAQRSRPGTPPPGQMVDIAGRSLHIRCVGPASASPAVILEAGGGDYSNRWTAVQDLLAPRIRSCAYDRAGLGWSAGTEQPMAQDNADLRALLTAVRIDGPLVLVGHSLGALLARRYAIHHPADVAGMVLAAPTHESTFLFSTRDNQWKRMRELPIGADFQELHLARQATPVPLGERPLIVLVGTRPEPSVSTPADIAREKAAETEDQARLSNNSKLVLDPSSGHHIHVDNPQLVARAIEEVVVAARNRTRLTDAR